MTKNTQKNSKPNEEPKAKKPEAKKPEAKVEAKVRSASELPEDELENVSGGIANDLAVHKHIAGIKY